MVGLGWTVAGLIAAYGLFVVILYVAQERLMYHPDPSRPVPADWGLNPTQVERIRTADGLSLFAWHHVPRDPNAPYVVYYHGNAGHLGHRAAKIVPYIEAGYGVLLPSWRYNAGAGGRPSESGLLADGRAALDFLAARGVEAERTVLYGESLGSAVAVAMAAERPGIAAILLEAPFSSVADVAASRYWFAPVRKLIKATYDSQSRIGRVRASILIVHGEHDTIIPVRFARDLAAAAPDGTETVFLPLAGHNDLPEHGLKAVTLDFLNRKLGVFAPNS